MNHDKICFVNASNLDQKIHVCDDESAALLKSVLASATSAQWMLESDLETPNRVIPAVAPVAIAAVPTVELKEEPRGKELRVILISGTSTYRCATCDVTSDQMKLKSQVPASFCGKLCVAYISHHDMRENIEVTCEVAIDDSGASIVRFISGSELSRLSEWIADEAV